MKAEKKGRKTDKNSSTRRRAPLPDGASSDLLRALAAATTAYHEAPPERFEEARFVYEEALKRFQVGQSGEVLRTMTAGAGGHTHSTE